MAKKQTAPTRKKLIDQYMNFVLVNGKRPNSIFHFMKDISSDERHFYQHFSSFNHLEKMIFAEFVETTVKLISKNPEYEAYGHREKLFTFYYTLFELLTANRSFVVFSLDQANLTSKIQLLSEMRKRFLDYITSLGISIFKMLDRTQVAKFKDKTVEEVAWIQLVMTLKFYLNDDSENFEKTDVFIEKSIHAGFEIIEEQPFQKVMDFGKFILKERMQMDV